MENTDNTETESREDELYEQMFHIAERLEAKMSREHHVSMLAAILFSITMLADGELKPGKVLTLEDMHQNLTNILEAGGITTQIKGKENA